ncbi:MAG: hypothetical protein FJZ16_00550 [Candidatus Omnitrophica bacterium]|nr:hypothetical protein [Candidatus Omnitrophota bacterium]
MEKKTPRNIFKMFPARINEFSVGAIRTYGDEKLGASIAYSFEDKTAVTLYLYDQGASHIEDGVNSEIVQQARAMAKKDIFQAERYGFFRNLKMLIENEVEFNIGTEVLIMLHSAYSGISDALGDSLPVISDLYVTGLKDYICKIRVTRPSQGNEKNIVNLIQILLSKIASMLS